jgi:DNA mismatch repair protein MutS
LAELDVIASFAQIAEERHYVRPEILETAETEIVGGRHPVVEAAIGWDAYIPADSHLDVEGRADGPGAVILLTGPNMAGKTTYGRMVLLVSLLAQCGSFVPAQRARLGLVDRIFLRSGAADDIAGGRSTFMVEMTETAAILRNVTPRSLSFFDEVGRGTSTYDGMAIARAIVEYLASPGHRCRTIFSTHYHELAEIEAAEAAVRNWRMEVWEAADQVAFTYRVAPGSADRSYGVHVARLAGLPASVVARAADVLELLEREASPMLPRDSSRRVDLGMEHVLGDLADVTPEDLTPIEALNILARLQGDAARALRGEREPLINADER